MAPSVDDDNALISRRLQIMADRVRRAWTFVLAVAPIAAIALVEAALRRW